MTRAPALRLPEEMLPEDLRGKTVAPSSEQLGNGANGVVRGLLVDGKPSNAYVLKSTNVENWREADTVLKGLVDEIAINREIAEATKMAPIPNIVISKWVAHIEGKPQLLMPRVHGGTLDARMALVYKRALRGFYKPDQAVNHFRKLIRGPMEGLAALHSHGYAMNDLNRGNFLYDETGNRGVVIDLGLAGKMGDHKRPGTLGTTPPERLRSSDAPPTHENDDCSPLTEKADSYAFGAVLHAFVHNKFPTWCELDPAAAQDNREFEMFASAGEFRRRGTLFPGGAPHMDDLRGQGDSQSKNERALRTALRDAGFYELLDHLTHPEPAKRLSVRQALDESAFFNPG